jgi:hypothetical protein
MTHPFQIFFPYILVLEKSLAGIVERYFWIIIVVFGSKPYWRRAAICVDKPSILCKVHFA